MSYGFFSVAEMREFLRLLNVTNSSDGLHYRKSQKKRRKLRRRMRKGRRRK